MYLVAILGQEGHPILLPTHPLLGCHNALLSFRDEVLISNRSDLTRPTDKSIVPVLCFGWRLFGECITIVCVCVRLKPGLFGSWYLYSKEQIMLSVLNIY